MSLLDPLTMCVAAAIVVAVCGILYILDTLQRRANAAARLWSVAFVGGILSQLSYAVLVVAEDAWVAGVVGNTALVLTIGMLWLGCVRFNGPLTPLAGWVVGCASALTLVAALVAGYDGGAWAGAWAMFVSVSVLAGLACVETRRGGLVGFGATWWLTIVLGTVSVFYAARTVILLVTGPEGALFEQWFGTSSASILTIVLTITAVIAMVVLRVQAQAEPNETHRAPLEASEHGYLDRRSFALALGMVIERARQSGQPLAVVVLKLDGLKEIAAAFGSRHARELTERWREISWRSAPLEAFLALDGGGEILLAVPGPSDGEALTLANRLSSHLAGALSETEVEMVPTIGVGVATGVEHRDAEELIEAAHAAAEASIGNIDGAAVLDAARSPLTARDGDPVRGGEARDGEQGRGGEQARGGDQAVRR